MQDGFLNILHPAGFKVRRDVIRRNVGDKCSVVAACYFLCVYCMLRYKSNKIHRYSVNTYYVQSTVLGASQYEFYPKPCQWLAV